MMLLNPWEHQNALKTLYAKCVEETCTAHNITRIELDILLFLANNPCYETATDIVEVRYLAKSQVSTAIRLLEEKGYLRKEFAGHNRKTVHLKLCKSSGKIIHDGHSAQKKFLKIMLQGFSQEEIAAIEQYTGRMRRNINLYLKEETK